LGDAAYNNETYLHDVLTEEVLIISYDYNLHEPRLFSKYAVHLNDTIYNITLTEAAEASSSAPVFFSPKVIGD
jgi:patatin-like phospholipase/acyl hydrolase